ncbi:hypothetical protein BG006_008072 [Podila minutissima]|uniref:Uncharacterized protein n=1 Tax=Podila minutissima TaxID=64525 RepID=A0A9P5VPZ2_9FUNG|nr:hypothetical protein BG006_008072 [Podila minutissima]
MSSNDTGQKSQKAEKTASGRGGNGRDSNMQSEHRMETSRSSPLRAAPLRPEGTEFNVAGNDYGGARQKIPSSESTSVDNKGIPLPLDKAVVDEITADRKEKKQTAKDSGAPTTVLSSMGGGHTAASTLADFGGAGGKKASGDDLPRRYQQSTEALPKSLRIHAFETPSQSHDTKVSGGQERLHVKSKVPVQSLDDVDDDTTPQLHSLSQQFFAKSSSHSHEPSAHHSTAAPIHYSAMPPVHHAPPAHHSAPEHHFPAEHITPSIQAGAAVRHASTHASTVESTDPMHRAHAAPIYHAPTQIETIHMPHHGPAHAPAHFPAYAPTDHHTHIETIHEAYHPEEAHKKKAAPAHEVSNDYPVVALGKSHDEPIRSQYNDLAPVKSQTDGAGLNAASFPSFARPDASTPVHDHDTAEPSHISAAMHKGPIHAPAAELHPNMAHVHAQQLPTHTYKPNKRSKRARKAAKKQEAARSLGVLGSISEALVGRRKNTVSTPVMRLNEIFGEAEGPITHDAPTHAHGTAQGANIVAPAAAVAAGLGGIRNLLGAIHMPAIISRHPPDNAHHDDSKMVSDSAHSTHVVGHMQHRHTPSKAVALKTPKINLSLFPEEDASYPRGDASKHENPARPKSIVDVTEIHYQLPSHVPAHVPIHSARVPATVVQAPAVHTYPVPEPLRHAPLGRMHLDLHTHQAPNQPAGSAQSVHGAGHKHSNAAALKKPKANLNAFLEEQADYPRGDDEHHENNPSRPLHTPVEVHEALGHMYSDLHTHQAPNQPAFSAQSAHGASVVHNIHPQHKHSYAAAIKKPKVKLNAFLEEQADYPRGDKHHENKPSHPLHTPIEVHEIQLPAAMPRKVPRQRKNSKAAALKKAMVPVGAFPEEEPTYPRGDGTHHENTPSRPMHTPLEVQEVQLDAAHLHSHHDLHPTMGETAAAAVSHGLENIKAMLGGIHMPAISNPEAQATLASLGAATAVHAAASHKDDHKIRHQGASLPLMYGTPVHADTAHTPAKPAHVEHHDSRLTHAAAATPLSHVSHKAPAVVPVYIAEPVVQVHSQHPLQPTHAPAQDLAPVKASSASTQHNIAFGEHHRRRMEFHGAIDDDENYFSADDIKSPDTTSASKLKPGADPLIRWHNAPVSVIPPSDNAIKASSVHVVAPVYGQHASAPVASPQHYSRSAAPVIAAAAAIPIAGAIRHAEARVPAVHQAERPAAPVPVSAARIPIARPPVEMVAPVTIRKTATATNAPLVPKAPDAQLPNRSHIAPAIQHAPSVPAAHTTDALGHAHHAAAHLMGAAAASVKPDEVIVMESAMPRYKEAPKPDHAHHIPLSAVAPMIPIKTASAQAPHAQASVPAPAVAIKSTTTTAATPIAAPLDAKPKAEISDVKHKSGMTHNLSHVAAPVTATVATAANVYNAHNNLDAPVQTTHTIKPELKLHENDMIKPTPLSAARPVIPTSTETEHHSAKVASAPRPIIPQKEIDTIRTTTTLHDDHHPTSKPVAIEAKTALPEAKDVPVLETKTVVAPAVAAAVAPPIAANAIKTTTTTTTYDDPIVKPAEVKIAKPVVETAEPVVVAQAVQHEAPVLAKTTHTLTTTPAPIPIPVAGQETPAVTRSTYTAPIAIPVPITKHEETTVTANTKPAPVPTVRPVVAAAVAAPVAAAAVHHHTAAPIETKTTPNTVSTTETPTVSSAQQIQQQYQQSHQTAASSSSNTRHVDVPIEAASSSTQTTATRQVEMPIQMQHTTPASSSSNTVIPPPGYSGTIPTVNEGETVMWVKKVCTTHDYYDPEDEDGIDELGYRKDRDVSRYMPGVHFHQSNTNNVDHVVGVNAQSQPMMQTTAQYPMQPSLAQAQSQTTNAQSQQRAQAANAQAQSQSQSQSQMTNAQFQQHVQANDAYAQTLSPTQGQPLSPTQAQNQAQARRASQPQVHPNNPQTRRASQATFQQHLKDYRRRSSGTAANSSQNTGAGKNTSINNKQQRQAAQ